MAAGDLFFAYDEFDVEIAKKLESLDADSDDLFAALLDELSRSTGAIDLARVEAFYVHLKSLGFDRVYANYLNHPVRVAGSYYRIFEDASTDDILFGLCHNALEAGVVDRLGPDATPDVVGRIETMTIDRAREQDPEYRKQFYREIERHSPELFVFKALDKLDNAFWWPILDIEKYHADIVLEDVVPPLSQIDARLASYLGAVTEYVRDPDTKRRIAEGAGA